jgi:hypothetical protein
VHTSRQSSVHPQVSGRGSALCRGATQDRRRRLIEQRWDVRLYDAPDHRIVYRPVAVSEAIAEPHDPPQVRDPTGGGGVEARELVEGFADDPELSLNSTS